VHAGRLTDLSQLGAERTPRIDVAAMRWTPADRRPHRNARPESAEQSRQLGPIAGRQLGDITVPEDFRRTRGDVDRPVAVVARVGLVGVERGLHRGLRRTADCPTRPLAGEPCGEHLVVPGDVVGSTAQCGPAGPVHVRADCRVERGDRPEEEVDPVGGHR
jgi:hypothetical protein